MKIAEILRAMVDLVVKPVVQAVIPAGNDFHCSKNPADIRTDSISLYPGYGARD